MIRVTCAVIRNEENEVLVVQRGEMTDHPLKWEFPGGKLIPGETDEECIIREVREELSMQIVICGHLPEVEHDYGHKQVKLIPFVCDTLDDLPLLAEHIAYKWLIPGDLKKVDFSEADIAVAVNYVNSIIFEDAYHAISEPVKLDTEDKELRSMINMLMSMKEAEWISTSAIENPAIFHKLIEYSFSDDKKLAFHASWILTKVCDRYQELILPNLPEIIEKLNKLKNESAQRSILRIISLSNINNISDRYHGILADHCFSALRSGLSAIAIKAYSMEILYKLALIYPELTNELAASVNILQGEGSAGVVARGRIIMKKLKEIPKDHGSSQQLS